MDLIESLARPIALVLLVLGLLELPYYPLAVLHERKGRRSAPSAWRPSVSIIVPGFNEERVIANCVDSILAAGYEHQQVILVDDGSSDSTLAIMRRYEHLDEVLVRTQPNQGKAAALNTGLASATGEILFFVDADGVFSNTTVPAMLSGFDDPSVGAVCGNDEPVNLDRVQTRLLALSTHGTALVRRALAHIGLLTIVSGNIGAYRRTVIDEIGGFARDMVGEDLELTWRARRAGYQVRFCPHAMVYAEVPSTLATLWRQRVRWTRGLIQTARVHRSMLFDRRRGLLGWYLPYNLVSMLVVPVAQLAALVFVAAMVATGRSPISWQMLVGLTAFGALLALAGICTAIALDRAWRDLRFLLVVPVWPLFSIMMSLVVVHALALEARGAPRRWNKSERTGVVSRSADTATAAPAWPRRIPILAASPGAAGAVGSPPPWHPVAMSWSRRAPIAGLAIVAALLATVGVARALDGPATAPVPAIELRGPDVSSSHSGDGTVLPPPTVRTTTTTTTSTTSTTSTTTSSTAPPEPAPVTPVPTVPPPVVPPDPPPPPPPPPDDDGDDGPDDADDADDG